MNKNFRATTIELKARYTIHEIARCLRSDLVVVKEGAGFTTKSTLLGVRDGYDVHVKGFDTALLGTRTVKNIPTNWQEFKSSFLGFLSTGDYVKPDDEDSAAMNTAILGAIEDQQRKFEGDYDRVADDWIDCARILFKAIYGIVENGTPITVPHEVEFEDAALERTGNAYIDVMQVANMGVYISSKDDSEDFLDKVRITGMEIIRDDETIDLGDLDPEMDFLEYLHSTEPEDLLVNLL